MTGSEFLVLSKEEKQLFVTSTLTHKKDSPEGKVYYINSTACCRNRVEWGWGKAPSVCPHCGSPYWQKPALEYFLFTEQDQLVKELPNLDRLGRNMFPLMLDYAKNLIQRLIKNKKTLKSKDLNEKAHDAAALLIEVILKDKDHTMKWSFGGYLKRLCKSVVYKDKKHEQAYSLNALTGKGDRELLETKIASDYKYDPNSVILKTDPDDLANQLIKIIGKASDAIWFNTRSQQESLLFLLGMNLRFKHKDERLLIDFYSLAGTQTKKFVEKGELVVYSYLKSLA